MEPDEHCLIEQAKQRNEHAFLALMKRYRYILLVIIRDFLRKIVGYEEEDLQQEITLAAYQVMPRFRGNEIAFRSWLRRSTEGMCLNILDKQRKLETVDLSTSATEACEEALPNPFPTPDEELRQKELREAVAQAIAELSEQHRKVVILKDIDGLPYHEIARVLGIEEGTVKSQLSRARALLREKLRHLRSAKG